MIDTFACTILRQLTKFYLSASLEAWTVTQDTPMLHQKKAAISDKGGNSYFIKAVLLNGCDFDLHTYSEWNVLLR